MRNDDPMEINITKEPQYEVEEAVCVSRLLLGICWAIGMEAVLLMIAGIIYVCLVSK